MSAQELLTVSHLCRQFTALLSEVFGPIEFSEDPQSFITGQKQKHLDLMLEPHQLMAPIDDLSERALLPGASLLADIMKRDGAAVCFHLDLPERGKREGLHCSVQRLNGLSVRCLLQDPRYWPEVPIQMEGQYVLRFDVLYREAAQEIAA